MQYVELDFNGEHSCVVDFNEISIIQSEKEKVGGEDDFPLDESLEPMIVYGRFKTQPDDSRTKQTVVKQMNAALEHWLAYIGNNGLVHYIGINDIEYLDNVVLMAAKHEGAKPVLTKDVPFAALIFTPKEFLLPEQKEKSLTAFLRWDMMCIADNIINRHGLFCFNAEEENAQRDQVTNDNWKNFIDYQRLIQVAQSIN